MKTLRKHERKEAPVINERVRFPEVQVISAGGENLGVMPRQEALTLSQEAGLDLVLMSEQGGMGAPVCRIMDFGKVLYAKKKQQNKKTPTIQLKEVKMRPKIGLHDFETKIGRGIKFLKEGKRLKVTLEFRGRERITRNERGLELFNQIEQAFADAGLEKFEHQRDMKSHSNWTRIYYIKK